MKFALSLIAFVVVALILPFLIPGLGKVDGLDPEKNLPWQIQLDAQGGSTVFGLQPGASTLQQAAERFAGEFDLALIAAPDETGSVEAYFNQVALGFVLAKVIVTVDLPLDTVKAMRERAVKAEHMESTTRKITLSLEDQALARAAPIRSIAVIPTVNLDEATLRQRFGEPGERIEASENVVHLLYPKQGLDVVLDTKAKELFQYVAPRDFAHLREPLIQAAAAPQAEVK